MFTVTSGYNLTSGYASILDVLLENFIKHDIKFRPRSLSDVHTRFLKYFNNIEYFKEKCDLLLFPSCSHFDICNPLFHLNPHYNRIFFTMWESTRIGDLIIDKYNTNKALIVPNNWNRFNFLNQGCIVPIHTVPLFIDTDVFNYTNPVADDCFVFGVANDDPRKRLDQTIRCFLKAFPNQKDVKLKVKVSGQTKLKYFDSRIEICNDDYTQEQLKQWYCGLNVFVSGVSAEGWGLMQHESMACGRPVIAAAYAGLAEFMNEDNSFCLHYKEVDSDGFWKVPGGKWSLYDEDDMIETMRYCYNKPHVVYQKGNLAANTVSKFTIDFFIKNILNVLNMYT